MRHRPIQIRAIDWRAVFLIAGMLPLGIAMQDTGTASFVAGEVMNGLGDLGPWAVIIGLYVMTAAATMIIPTAALVVLMAPIVLSACATMGIEPQTAMMAVAMAVLVDGGGAGSAGAACAGGT